MTDEAGEGLVRPEQEPRGWHSRGYLPHFDEPGWVQAVTFRLADSLPAGARASSPASSLAGSATSRRLQEGGRDCRAPGRAPGCFETMDSDLDAGYGACVLRHSEAAEIVQDALLYGDGERYRLLAWVVMPNHVHALFQTAPAVPVSAVVHSWKSFTAKEINQLSGATGRLWQPDYFDRYMRDGKHLEATLWYIEDNPVKAGLVDTAEAWRWSSARRRNE